MGTVKHILQTKGNMVHSICPDCSVYEALETLEDKNVGALVVLDNEQRLIGVFTERDYARKVVLKGRSSKEVMVMDIMGDRPVSVSPSTSIDDCMQLMTDKAVRHLPVVENDKVIGIISIGDIVRFILSEKDFIISNLEHYIVS
jgi:CBS domain-containing protein